MPDKLSVVALREVGSTPGVADTVVTKLLDRYAGAMSKEAERRARATLLAEAGARTIADFSQLERLTAERDARPTREEELKHGRHQRWMGGFWGFAIGMIASTVIILTMQGVIWATAANSFREQAMTGALLQSQERDERNNEPSYTITP